MAKNKSKADAKAADLKPTTSTLSGGATQATFKAEGDGGSMLYGKKNYMIMLGGVALIFIGYLLMAGGSMPSPDVWDDNVIYSTRRTLIAPIVILAGLGLQIYAIFSKK